MKNLNVNVGEIYSLKMNSGEELIAKVVGIDVINEAIRIEQPVSVGPTPNGQMGLVPSMFTYNHQKSVMLNTSSVAIIAETDEAIKAKYIQATTGIAVPEKRVILG